MKEKMELENAFLDYIRNQKSQKSGEITFPKKLPSSKQVRISFPAVSSVHLTLDKKAYKSCLSSVNILEIFISYFGKFSRYDQGGKRKEGFTILYCETEYTSDNG